jgi:predicted lactoylglutathione lyase
MNMALRRLPERISDEAIRKGASSVRSPGQRPDVSSDYFGTVVRDPDGHSLEVVHWAR